eukprot:8246905-Heterocapsa_arctica.AAC.1
MGQKWMWTYAQQEIRHVARPLAAELISEPRPHSQSQSQAQTPSSRPDKTEAFEEGHAVHPPIQEVPPGATFVRHLVFLISGLASLGGDPEFAIVGRSAGTHTAIALSVHCTASERWRAFGATVWWAKAIVVGAAAAPSVYWEWLHLKFIANMVIINSNEDELTPIDMAWLSSLISDRTIARHAAGITNRIDPSHPAFDNAPGTW